ncbi:uncharacterized protein GGS22DRAFT_54750 [Annulohypoxylon maeteangense]|uniref:uncharacterized protein n=1 Tax=Annulohypoxylon maeteangense TaxID=1927788 RepID=UPI002007B6D2|nr:uncharacterized protein GGS22DRAFT_54750 [Annulohypoxylon maeteangense]KAI0881664.1 hypothetical protein GGS22DRAFT_54750 [Annulohypoxylon maeteangense]
MMARRVSPNSIEAKFYLEKYENARKTGKDQEMTQFLESVSTQAGSHEIVDDPNVNDSLGQRENGDPQKRQGRFNDNSLSKMKNIFNVTTAATGKDKAGLGYAESTELDDPEKPNRKLSSKMTKIKKFFGKDDNNTTHSITTSAEKVLAMLKSPNALPFNISKLPELTKIVQNVSNADLSRNNAPRFMIYHGNSEDSGNNDYVDESDNNAIERGRPRFKKNTAAAYDSTEDTNRKGVAASDTSGGPKDSVRDNKVVQHETGQEDRCPSVPPHRDPVHPHRQAKHEAKVPVKKPLYDDQGFLCGDSESEDCHFTKPPAVPRHGVGVLGDEDENEDEVGERSTQHPKRTCSDENVINSLAIAHYTPSIQQFLAKPKQAARDYQKAIQLVKAQQEAKARRLAEAKAKGEGNSEGSQDYSSGGAIPSVPSFKELKRKEAEQGQGPEQLHKDKQVGVKNWLDAPRLDPRPESPDEPRQYGVKPAPKDSKRKTLASYMGEKPISRESQRVRNFFGLSDSSNSTDGSKRVDVMSTIEEDESETDFKPHFPNLYHPSPTRVVRITPSIYEGLSFLRKESEASGSPQRGTVEPPSSPFDRDPRDQVQDSSQPGESSSPPITPNAQIIQGKRNIASEVEYIKKHIEDAYNGKCEYNVYDAPSDITVGLSPITLLGMYPSPLHIIKDPKKPQGNAHSPTPAYKGPRGSKPLQGPRPLPVASRHSQPQQPKLPEQPPPLQLPQPLQLNTTGASTWGERFRGDSDEVSLGRKGEIIEEMGHIMLVTLERMDRLEERVEVLTNSLNRVRLLIADIVGVDTAWYHKEQNAEEHAQEEEDE